MVQGKRCVLSDCCCLLDGAVLAAGSVVPPFAVMGGSPAQVVGKLPEAYQEQRTEHTNTYYRHFRKQEGAK
jgi:dynactin-5